MGWIQRIAKLPIGYSEVEYKANRYGVNKTVFNDGKSVKVYAKELGGTHFISFNYYETTNLNLLKPCEMPRKEVLDFIEYYKPIGQRR